MGDDRIWRVIPLFCPFDVGCCDSCHEDEAYGFSMWWNDWLHCCCTQLRVLGEHGVGTDDEPAVRALVAKLT